MMRSFASCLSSPDIVDPLTILSVVDGVPKIIIPRAAPPSPPEQIFSADSTDNNPKLAASCTHFS